MKHFLLCLCTALNVACPIVRCQQTNSDQSVRSASTPSSDNENDGGDDHMMNTAFPPEGAGLFRDPMDVLGPKFSPSMTINLCEVQLHQHADEISDIQFTGRGNKTCTDMCVQYRQNMHLDGPVGVALIENYCDYTGLMHDFDSECGSDLSTTCTCMYKMRCNARSRVITYIFEVNCKGFIKVSVTELMKKNCIT